jgi:hypothetical protein
MVELVLETFAPAVGEIFEVGAREGPAEPLLPQATIALSTARSGDGDLHRAAERGEYGAT